MCKYFLYSYNCLWVTQCHVCILLTEKIFFLHVYPQHSFFFFFFLKLGLCLFIYPHPFIFLQNYFSQNLFCFSYFYRGINFVYLCCSQGELLLFIRGVVSIFYRVELFCLPLILYFLLSFIAYVYSLLGCLCQYVTKRGRFR